MSTSREAVRRAMVTTTSFTLGEVPLPSPGAGPRDTKLPPPGIPSPQTHSASSGISAISPPKVNSTTTGTAALSPTKIHSAGSGSATISPPETHSAGSGSATISPPETHSAGSGSDTISPPEIHSTTSAAAAIAPPKTNSVCSGSAAISPPETHSASSGSATIPPHSARSGFGCGIHWPRRKRRKEQNGVPIKRSARIKAMHEKRATSTQSHLRYSLRLLKAVEASSSSTKRPHTKSAISGLPSLATADKDKISSESKQTGKYKRPSCNRDNEPPAKRCKAEESQILLTGHQILIVIPVMAERLQHMLSTYCCWRSNGFTIVLVFKEDERKKITTILQQYRPFVLHSYKSNPSNAGIAKKAAFDYIKQNYVNDRRVTFAMLIDDTVNKIINSRTKKSIMTSPTVFYNTIKKFAQISPVFGGTVAYKRHPKKCKQIGIQKVKGGFLQQALVFSCRGASTLTNHFMNVKEYIMKMRRLTYRSVPFGEDVAFQISLYDQGILHRRESAQFWGLGVSRMKHTSATKPSFNQLDDNVKEELKDMMIYLKKQGALSIDSCTKKLIGVKVIPGGSVRIRISGRVGERPWSAANNFAFPRSDEQI